MTTTSYFTVNGQPLPAPDADVTFSYEDLDSSDSGRDEQGVMHRIVERYKVGSWGFQYSHLTEAERRSLESLFPASPTFTFGYLGPGGTMQTCTAYRSKYTAAWHNATTGDWRNYGFTVVQC